MTGEGEVFEDFPGVYGILVKNRRVSMKDP